MNLDQKKEKEEKVTGQRRSDCVSVLRMADYLCLWKAVRQRHISGFWRGTVTSSLQSQELSVRGPAGSIWGVKGSNVKCGMPLPQRALGAPWPENPARDGRTEESALRDVASMWHPCIHSHMGDTIKCVCVLRGQCKHRTESKPIPAQTLSSELDTVKSPWY